MDRSTALLAALAVSFAAGVAPAPAAAGTATHPVGTFCALDVFPACEPAQDFAVTTDGALSAEVTVTATCLSADVRFAVDGGPPVASGPLAPGESTGVVNLGPVTPGTHTLTVGADVASSIDCEARSWSGTLNVTTTGVSGEAVAFVLPGETATVSTVVAGSPRPAGVAATLFRSQAATTTARFSVATYDGLPSGLPPNPVRAAAYLDLQLTDAYFEDVIAGEFLPPNPVFPTDPTLPPNPVFPSDPILPPNPVRLAYWDGDAWSAVFDSSGDVPDYLSVDSVFEITFDAASTPSVTALGGTVFAVIPGYYFRGFGTPLNPDMLNVAKAGRAVPLKWQVFDFNATPVLDLDPAVVKLSSVAIPCEAAGGGTDTVEEYAAGASGLHNLGDGIYQLNWATLRSYAGSCRRVRLDLGERNPDGTVFYRTADFQFTR